MRALRLAAVARTLGARAARRRRVPLVRQTTALDCGRACLAMILGFHGRPTRLQECRERCDSGRDGTSAATLVRVARGYGLTVRAYRAEPAHLGRLPLPLIAHWGFEHFVVVERWSAEGAVIVDPARGRLQVGAAELDERLTGIMLTFEAPEGWSQSQPAVRSSWPGYVRTYLSQAPGVLAQVVGASMVLQLLALALPLASKLLVDQVIPLGLTELMPVLGLGLGLVLLSQLATTSLRGALLVWLEARIDLRLVPGFFEHLLRLPFRFFEARPSGDLLMRLGSHALIRDVLTGQALSLVLDGSLALGSLALLIAAAPRLGAAALALGAVQVVVLCATARRLGRLNHGEIAARAACQSYLVEALEGIATLKSSGAEARALDHWTRLFRSEMHVSLRRSHATAAVEAVQSALRGAAPALLLWLGAWEVLEGRIGLGTMLACSALGTSFLMPVASLVQNGQRLPTVGVHLERLADILQAEPEQPAGPALAAPRRCGRIQVRGLGFRYHAEAPWVLRDVSFEARPGESVALVGPTGCGKTTLLKLLLGFYPPTEGEILYDDVPLGRLDLRELRQRFGVVLQEPFLFSGSIRDNIAFADPGLDLERIRGAARLAAVDEDVMAMPMAYDTRLSEGSNSLSGGQRQRLCLARALAHRPAVLFLDEATSHLDAVTERRVEENLRQVGCTRIVIAHRLSTIRHADQILVLEAGAVAERGRHLELLSRGGAYAALVRHQDEPAAAG